MRQRIYMVIDLKSFYASVECVERGLDPMEAKLVVADPERTDRTICLAVSPALKALGVKNRCRVYEIPKDIEYIMAPPRMALYLKRSAEIYAVYLKYISMYDIHVYSIDEAFLDVTEYLKMYGMRARVLAETIMQDILDTTGITATCGLGTNLYLAKVALDITAKHSPDRIGMLDEKRYCQTLWNHTPLTDFWRIGPGIAARLEGLGIRTMGQLAHTNEELIYRLFGIDAELLIDHAWGRETTTIPDIKAYKPKSNSLGSGQVLPCGYPYDKGRLIVEEMADLLVLDLVDKRLITESATLYLGYDFHAEKSHANGTTRFDKPTSSTKKILDAILQLYDKIGVREGTLHRVNITFNNVMDEVYEQMDFFSDPITDEKEKNLQRAMVELKKRFGRNAIVKGMNLQEGARTLERNEQIGGHKA